MRQVRITHDTTTERLLAVLASSKTATLGEGHSSFWLGWVAALGASVWEGLKLTKVLAGWLVLVFAVGLMGALFEAASVIPAVVAVVTVVMWGWALWRAWRPVLGGRSARRPPRRLVVCAVETLARLGAPRDRAELEIWTEHEDALSGWSFKLTMREGLYRDVCVTARFQYAGCKLVCARPGHDPEWFTMPSAASPQRIADAVVARVSRQGAPSKRVRRAPKRASWAWSEAPAHERGGWDAPWTATTERYAKIKPMKPRAQPDAAYTSAIKRGWWGFWTGLALTAGGCGLGAWVVMTSVVFEVVYGLSPFVASVCMLGVAAWPVGALGGVWPKRPHMPRATPLVPRQASAAETDEASPALVFDGQHLTLGGARIDLDAPFKARFYRHEANPGATGWLCVELTAPSDDARLPERLQLLLATEATEAYRALEQLTMRAPVVEDGEAARRLIGLVHARAQAHGEARGWAIEARRVGAPVVVKAR